MYTKLKIRHINTCINIRLLLRVIIEKMAENRLNNVIDCETIIEKLDKILNEKRRRDSMTTYLRQMEKLVPLVPRNNTRISKQNILRLSVAYLRLHKRKQITLFQIKF